MKVVLLLLSVSSLPVTIHCFSVPRHPQHVKEVTIQVNGYTPTVRQLEMYFLIFQNDDYIAVSIPIEPGYIVRFEPLADADRVHHILLYGCTYPAWSRSFWKGFSICRGYSHILYAWARNAPDFRLPQEVAFSVGHDFDSIKYLVMQVHYAHRFIGKVFDYSGITLHMIDERPRNLAAVLLFMSGTLIQPGFSHFQTNMSCLYNSDTPIHPFAFRTHTHNMGRVVSAFYKHSDKWIMIGKRNPQWPQLFQPIKTNLTILNDDLMAATCVYDSSMKKSVVRMGSTGEDEMCNFYMMFYWDATSPDPFPDGAVCTGQDRQNLVNKEYPVEGTVPLQPHPDWEHRAHQGRSFGVIEGMITTSVDGIKLGQVAALSFDSFGNLIILHRGSRVWDSMSFDLRNNFREKRPIMEDVILVTYSNEPNGTLSLRDKYGHAKFYMPHGLTVDQQNDYYTTDVGSHQVIKWSLSHGYVRSYFLNHVKEKCNMVWRSSLSQVFALGEKFVPGNDEKHFCKPAGIAVTMDGSIFVADGYCNNRIMKFDRNGQFLTQWGESSYNSMNGITNLHLGIFSLPHDIVANDDGSLLYVTDRENARIQIFRSDGQAVGQIVNPANSTAFENIYSADYHNGALYFIPGRQQNGLPIRIFNAHVEAARVQYSFEPTNPFNRPHMIRVSNDGRCIYIGELGQDGGRILQYVINHDWDHPCPKFCIAGNDISSSSLLSNFAVDRSSQFSIPATFLVVFVAVSALFFFAYRRRKFVLIGKQYSVLNRAGFKPLRTDDSETSNDDSDDDFICSRQKSNDRF
uniref:Peptidylglycine monooxygenase n=1 Tax=Elaeophora elaphi TaxID=1147741 RepID=A0A0R3RRY3_9BILA